MHVVIIVESFSCNCFQSWVQTGTFNSFFSLFPSHTHTSSSRLEKAHMGLLSVVLSLVMMKRGTITEGKLIPLPSFHYVILQSTRSDVFHPVLTD